MILSSQIGIQILFCHSVWGWVAHLFKNSFSDLSVQTLIGGNILYLNQSSFIISNNFCGSSSIINKIRSRFVLWKEMRAISERPYTVQRGYFKITPTVFCSSCRKLRRWRSFIYVSNKNKYLGIAAWEFVSKIISF